MPPWGVLLCVFIFGGGKGVGIKGGSIRDYPGGGSGVRKKREYLG